MCAYIIDLGERVMVEVEGLQLGQVGHIGMKQVKAIVLEVQLLQLHSRQHIDVVYVLNLNAKSNQKLQSHLHEFVSKQVEPR